MSAKVFFLCLTLEMHQHRNISVDFSHISLMEDKYPEKENFKDPDSCTGEAKQFDQFLQWAPIKIKPAQPDNIILGNQQKGKS